MNQEGAHSFLEASSNLSCNPKEGSGESHCFKHEKDGVVHPEPEQHCIDLFFSTEANLSRANLIAASAAQSLIGQYVLIDIFRSHPQKVSAIPDLRVSPNSILQIQKIVVLLI